MTSGGFRLELAVRHVVIGAARSRMDSAAAQTTPVYVIPARGGVGRIEAAIIRGPDSRPRRSC